MSKNVMIIDVSIEAGSESISQRGGLLFQSSIRVNAVETSTFGVDFRFW